MTATWGSAYTICLARLVADESTVEVSLENNEGGGDEFKTMGNLSSFNVY